MAAVEVIHWRTTAVTDASMTRFMGDPTTQVFVATLDASTYSKMRDSIV